MVSRNTTSHATAVRSQLLHERRDLRDVAAAAIARVEADAHVLERRVPAQQQLVDERAQQRRRDVVDAIEAEIFESVQRDALTGAGQAADDHEAHELSLALLAGVSPREPQEAQRARAFSTSFA